MASANSANVSVGELLRSLDVGPFLTIKKVEQGGALQARKLSSGGIQFYWRYTHEGVTDRVVVGGYDPSSPPRSLTPGEKGFSVAAAIEACRAKATKHVEQVNDGGYRAHIAAQKAKRVYDQKQTLSKLLDAYTAHLKKEKRRSFADAGSIFRLHVTEAWPDIADRPANSVTPAQITDMMRRLADAGTGRTANKLRAYMRAAYQCALDVDSLASIPATFRPFHITVNPAALTKREAKYDKADKRPLSVKELQQYWKLIKDLPGVKGAALRLHLLSGGQRIEQLLRLKKSDVSKDSFFIFDIKGRPGQGPRKHTVPLLPLAASSINTLKGVGEFVLSTDGGVTALNTMTLSNWAKEVAMDIPDFQLKRIRSGVETALAAAGVSKEIRGHLQSHGLAGIQARHYDAHDYLPEKRAALQILMRLLGAKTLPRKRTGRSRA